jgi:putative oxidoreductase
VDARSLTLLLARLLVAQLFLLGSAQKWFSPGEVEGLLAARGWPGWLVWPALLANLAAGVALLLGWRLREVAVFLAAYCGATSLFHYLPDDPWQMTIFVKNWAIAGGCLALAASGPGRYAVGRQAAGRLKGAPAPAPPQPPR